MMNEQYDDAPTLLIGGGLRPLVCNAARRNRSVIIVTHTATRDLEQAALLVSVPADNPTLQNPSALAQVARQFNPANVIYGAGFDDEILTLARLTDIGPVTGCSMETVRKTRDPESLLRASNAWSFSFPPISYRHEDLDDATKWMARPFSRLTGKHSLPATLISPANEGHGYFYQKTVTGLASSAHVVSDGSEAVLLGLMARFTHNETTDLRGWSLRGEIFPHPFTHESLDWATAIADALTLEFDIKGLWSFDFVYHGDATLLSVNPRPSFGLGLIDMATWNDLVGLHIEASVNKQSNLIVDPGPSGSCFAQARIYAEGDMLFNSDQLGDDSGLADIPLEGTLIPDGHPLITLTAEEETYTNAKESLMERARTIMPKLLPSAVRSG